MYGHALTAIFFTACATNPSSTEGTPDASRPPDAVVLPPIDAAITPPDPDLVAYIDAVEAAETALGDDPTRMLSHLRKLYYGATWSVSSASSLWDVLIPCGQSVEDPRPVLGPDLHGALTANVEVAGRDVGHIFTVLEAAVCPRDNVLSVDMNNEDLSGWPGDVGSAIAMRHACETLGAGGASCGGQPGGPLEFYINLLAGDADMEGDLDPLAMRAGEMGHACAGSAGLALVLQRPISQILRDYYLNANSALGTLRRQRNRCVLELMGGTFSDGTLTNRSAVESAYASPIAANAALSYIYAVSALPSVTARAAMDDDAASAMTLVVDRLLASADTY